MPYRLTIEETVAAGIKRICAEQIDRAVAEIDRDNLDRHATVHQIRKRCKKIRGSLRLVRSDLDRGRTYREENAWFRDSARPLSHARDAEALIETWDALVEHFTDELDRPELEPIRQYLVSHRQETTGEGTSLDELLTRFRARMLMARDRIGDWSIEGRGFEVLRAGLERTYRRARKAFARAYEMKTVDAFHQWRKRVKYHWYHCRLLSDPWPEVMRARRDEADRLADLLGDEHDLAVFSRSLDEAKSSFHGSDQLALVSELANLRRTALQAQARPLGRRLLAEKPKHLGDRLGTYWAAWRAMPTPD